ncbi:hypothetical protein, partial [Anaerotignum faecicola]
IAEGFGKPRFPNEIRSRHGSLLTNQPKGLLLCRASISDEENSEFQGFSADGTRLFILLFQQVEILIST